jgi:hypothetical protein
MGSRRGEINGWTCDQCGETTYVVHVADGVTPMFLACRAEGVEPAEAKCKATTGRTDRWRAVTTRWWSWR